MKIRLAKTAGYCMGVRRAVELALDLKSGKHAPPMVSYGPLIHNPQTLEILEARGVRAVDSLDDIDNGTVVVRAHGISPAEHEALAEKGVEIIDATCPRVNMVQRIIEKQAEQGRYCIIVGDKDHPEVRGLIGFASAGGTTVSSAEETDLIEGLDPDGKYCVVAQTTQQRQVFDDVVAALEARSLDLQVFNTICNSTRRRQEEVRRLADEADTMIVVGGRGSGNTRRLVQVAQSCGIPAIHVETADELDPAALAHSKVVGVTAGASTPNWQIQAVIDRLKTIDRSRSTGFVPMLRRVFDITVMTYLWAALGGGGLTASCLILQNRPISWAPITAAMLFVFSMHLLNRIMDRSGAVRFNTPEIGAFYARHRVLLSAVGASSSVLAVVVSSWIGFPSMCLLAAMIGAGLLYTAPLRYKTGGLGGQWRSLKELPGSKTPLVALGWAMVAAVVPAASTESFLYAPGVGTGFILAAGLIFWRSALSDLLDIQGDRLVGRETIPILIGVDWTKVLLQWLLGVLAVILVLAVAVGRVPWAGLVLLGNIVLFQVFFAVYARGQLEDRMRFECALDGNLLLAGVVATMVRPFFT